MGSRVFWLAVFWGCLFPFGFLLEAEPVEREWTLLFYMNADNDLDPYADKDFTKMMAVGSNPKMAIVTECDRLNGPAQKIVVHPGRLEVLAELGEVDMGDVDHFIAFAKWGMSAYPAKKYLISFWNHGSGWYRHRKLTYRGVSYDDSTGNYIKTNQIATALNEIKSTLGHNLDILAFDACLMAMAEVHYAYRDTVNTVVSSEESEPGDGWPITEMLRFLAAKPAMGGAELSSFLVAEFQKAYNGGIFGKQDTTYTAYDLGKFCAALPRFNQFCADYRGRFIPHIKQILESKVQKFDYKTHIDLPHFLELLGNAVKKTEPSAAGEIFALRQALLEGVILHRQTGAITNSQGMAIYFPRYPNNFLTSYQELEWARDNGWDEYCRGFYLALHAEEIVVALSENNPARAEKLVGFWTSAQRVELQREVNQLLHQRGWDLPSSAMKQLSGLFKK